MNRCNGCRGLIWFFQNATPNYFWHEKCYLIWEKGYYVAMRFAQEENHILGIDGPDELYKKRMLGAYDKG